MSTVTSEKGDTVVKRVGKYTSSILVVLGAILAPFVGVGLFVLIGALPVVYVGGTFLAALEAGTAVTGSAVFGGLAAVATSTVSTLSLVGLYKSGNHVVG